MESGSSIPGFRELCDWPTPPALPFRIKDSGFYRDPSPYTSFYVDLVDANGSVYSFFFERFLGRLCYGSELEVGDDAAFLKKGSVIQVEAFRIIEALASAAEDPELLLERLEIARSYV